MPETAKLPSELDYVVLLFALFVIPRVLQRFRLPAAVTCVALGAVAGMGLGLFGQDLTIAVLAVLGIVSLFLFAGLDIDFHELRRELRVLLQHVAFGLAALALVSWMVQAGFQLSWRPAVLVALALLTPSTGFILDSLPSLGVSDAERFWIKSKAVATEIVALVVLFFTLQSTNTGRLSLSLLTLGGIILLLPAIFRIFAARIAPYAPNSEFAFLLMIAVVCASVTRRLGVYYLVGAFVAGVTAQRFRMRLPAIASERMLHAVEVFASVFIPFYFFSAGLHLRKDAFGIGALLFAAGFLIVVLPLRVLVVALHRRMALGEPLREGARIGVSMLPTLVFGLVIVNILQETFTVSPALSGGLMIYTLSNTVIPGWALRLPAPEMDVWHETGEDRPSPAPS
ncbi:MAG: cation:proton antiporter [Gemmatimonadetes bacterium]|nr:cation:proton antiporter [Gemmatimonadota bacterium]